MSMFKLPIVIGISLFLVNDASSATRAYLRSEVALEAQSMSFSHAVGILRSMNRTSPELLSLIQENLGTSHSRSYRLKGSKHHAQKKTAPDANADYSSGLKNAMVRLNEMMLETIMHMDEQDLECRQFSRQQQSYITELEQDSQYYSQLVTKGNAAVLDGRQHTSSYGDDIPRVEQELKAHDLACSAELADLHRQLRVTKSDAEVMDKILNMTQCNDVAYEKADAAGLKATMLQCVNKRTGKSYTKMRATDPELKAELAKLQHAKSLQAVSSVIVPQTASKATLVQQHIRDHSQATIAEPLTTLAENNFNDRGDSDVDTKSTYTYTLGNGYSVALSGWTHTRTYAKGFMRNTPGWGSAVVSGLKPEVSYKWAVYQYAAKNPGTHLLSVNGHPEGDTTSSASEDPTKEGKTVADADGVLTFYFQRKSGTVELSGLAVALDEPKDSAGSAGAAGSTGSAGSAYGQVIIPAAPDNNLEQGAEECSISNSSKCPELRERFVNIAGGVADAIEELEGMIANKQLRCQQIRAKLQAEMDHYGYWYKAWETRLALAVAGLGEARTQFENKQQELINARHLYEEKIEACHKSISESKSELCALTKIRGELATMSSWDKEITDCQVSDWDVPLCGVTCGGGTQQLTRICEMSPGAGTEAWEKGHECPLLEAKQSCNEFRCPVDCELADWEEWSRCTVTCGGGVQERMRSTVVHPTPSGNPCEMSLESALCNSGPCDVDCELSAWTEWSTTCTKMCGGGQSTRIKSLVTAETGAGTCPTFYEDTRFGARPCNTQPCDYHSNVARCHAKVDVILLIDGSGSLGSSGWNAIKKTSLALAGAMGSGASLGAVLFSGPTSSCKRIRCTGRAKPFFCSSYYFDIQLTPEDCGVNWVSHLTTDIPSVISGIDNMKWPGECTLTSKAIKSAEIEMINSRRGVPSVVIVLTDGYPYSSMHTEANSIALKASGARLMMVPIGQSVADTATFEKMVSYPVEDNLVFAESFETLTDSNQTINTIISDFCTSFGP